MKRGASSRGSVDGGTFGRSEDHPVEEKKMRSSNEESEMAAHLKLEDVRYMLRALEEDAYSSIVSALRAQGPLTDYKKALLDHLKASLFISAERHKAEIRRAANDDLLLIISKKMNPMCDPYQDWYLEGSHLGRVNPTPSVAAKALATPGQDSAKKIAERLSKRASEHNQNLTDGEQALLHLIQLPKKPQVPETLRYLMNHGASTSKKSGPKLVAKATSPMKATHRSPAKAARKEAIAERKRKESETRPKPKVEEVEETTSNSAAESVSEPASRSETPSSGAVPDSAAAGLGQSSRAVDSSTTAEVVSAVAAAGTKLSPQATHLHTPLKNGPSLMGPGPTATGNSNAMSQLQPENPLKPQSRAKAVKKVSSANPNLKTVSPKRGNAPAPGPPGSPRGVKPPVTTASWPANTAAATSTTQKRTNFSGAAGASTTKVKTEGSPTVPVKGPNVAGAKTSIAPPRGEPVMRCARVEPFLFPAAPPGSTQKPPRGNPDKRVKKHPNIVPGLMRTAGRSVGSLGNVGSTSSLKRRKPPLFYDEIPVPEGQDPSSTNVDDYIYSCLPHRRERRPVAEYYGSYYSGSGSGPGNIARSASGTTIVRGSPSTPRYTTTTAQYHTPFYASGATAARLTATGVAPNAAVQAAYSSPTRPYYGNPSAAALGITVRPTGDGGKPVVTAQQHSTAASHNSGNSTDKIYLMRQPSTGAGVPPSSGNAGDLSMVSSPGAQHSGQPLLSGGSDAARQNMTTSSTPQLIAPKPTASSQASQQVILTGHPHHHPGVPNGPGGNGNVVIVRRVPGERRTSVSSPVGFAPSSSKHPAPGLNNVSMEPQKIATASTVYIAPALNHADECLPSVGMTVPLEVPVSSEIVASTMDGASVMDTASFIQQPNHVTTSNPDSLDTSQL